MASLMSLINWIPGGLQGKLIVGGILIALVTSVVGGGFWYVHHLQHSVATLKVDNHDLTKDVANKTDTITEDQRRTSLADQIDTAYKAKRQANDATYQKKVANVDKSIQSGNDKPVGPLLKEFFNEPQ